MSYKPIDRSVVKTRDIILDDGRTYDTYVDPWKVATDKIWQDMQDYELRGGRFENQTAPPTVVSNPCRANELLLKSARPHSKP